MFQKVRATALALWDESIFRTGTEPSKFHKFVHFWVLAGRSFVRNRCPIRASALSYASLLALIPMLALVMSVTTSVLKDEGADQIEHFIQGLIDYVMPPAVIETSVDEGSGLHGRGAGGFHARSDQRGRSPTASQCPRRLPDPARTRFWSPLRRTAPTRSWWRATPEW